MLCTFQGVRKSNVKIEISGYNKQQILASSRTKVEEHFYEKIKSFGSIANDLKLTCTQLSISS